MEINRSQLRKSHYIYLPILATLATIISHSYNLLPDGISLSEIPFLFDIALQIAAIIVMVKFNVQKGLKLYILCIFVGHTYFTIIHLETVYQDLLGFTISAIFLVVFSTFVFTEPGSYILAIANFLLLSVVYTTSELYPTKYALIHLLYISLTYLITFEAKRLLNSLHNDKLNSLKRSQLMALEILGKVSEIKDSETDLHLKRVEVLICELVRALMNTKRFREYLTDKYLEDISSAAYLHDIGKIGISDSILNKPGKLTNEEFALIKQHTIIGYDLLLEAKKKLKEETLYTLALEIARHHHERYDGNGYPDGLSGEEIPLSARIMAIVDVYDALTSKRPYKEAFSHKEALRIIEKDSGSHFDPYISRVFLDIEAQILLKLQQLS